MTNPPRILIACIGNIFFGDDAFGVHVAQHLARIQLPDHVRAVDFGIRGIDLTYALLDICDIAILVDAIPRGEAPGTLFLVEPQLPPGDGEPDSTPNLLDAHSMNPLNVLRAVRAMGGRVRRVLLVGCEPTPFDTNPDTDLRGELSPPVLNAVEPAVQLIQNLVIQFSTQPGGLP